MDELEIIILSQVSQTKTNTTYVESKKWYKYLFTKQADWQT